MGFSVKQIQACLELEFYVSTSREDRARAKEEERKEALFEMVNEKWDTEYGPLLDEFVARIENNPEEYRGKTPFAYVSPEAMAERAALEGA
jgi:hypothetical protein